MSKNHQFISFLAFFLMVFLGRMLFPKAVLSQSPVLIDLPGTISFRDAGGGYYDFTYTEGGWSFTGTLYKPPQSGARPGIVISHGKGGGGVGFCPITQDWFPKYVRICPNYTHAAGSLGGNNDPSSWAGSPENVKRATKSLDILVSQELTQAPVSASVDPTRLFMWGNSMGAMVTVATAAEVGNRIKAASYTAGGLSDGQYLPNDPAIASGVDAPFLMLHALNDGTVDPSASRRWRDALISYDKTYQLVWFSSGGHNMMHDPVYKPVLGEFMKAWFENPRPSLNSINPTSGTTGTSVLFNGSNFGTNINNLSKTIFYKYQFGSISSWSAGSVSASVPQSATSGPARVIVPQGPLTNNLLDSIEGGMRSNGVDFIKDRVPPPTTIATPTSQVSPTPPSTQLKSDINSDGRVDGKDLLVWTINFGKNLSGKQNGDFNNNGGVEILDYAVWASEITLP